MNFIHEAEWTPFETHFFSENLVEPGIESGNSLLNHRGGSFAKGTGNFIIKGYTAGK
jgi:hypothetical protein